MRVRVTVKRPGADIQYFGRAEPFRGAPGAAGDQGTQGPIGPQGPAGAAAPDAQVGNTYYLHNGASDDADVGGYKRARTLVVEDHEESTRVVNVTQAAGDVFIGGWVTEPGEPGSTEVPTGQFDVRLYYSLNSGAGTFRVRTRLYKRTTGGVETELFSLVSDEMSSTESVDVVQMVSVYFSGTAYPIDETDRLVVKLYGLLTGSGTRTLTTYFEGHTHVSNIATTVPAA